MSPSEVSSNSTASNETLFLTRGLIAIAWAVAFAAVSQSLTTTVTVGAGILLVIYPLIDTVANLIDGRSQHGSARQVLLANAVASAIAAVALGVAATQGAADVLAVFGVWAGIAGAAQLVVALRRRAQLGNQWPLLLAGGFSVVAGVVYVVAAAGDEPRLSTLVIYTATGGLEFVIQAWLLARRRRRLLPSMTPHPDAATSDGVATPANAWWSILELGRLAPTPHNTQWYRVRVVDDRTAHVCIDESIAIPFTDPNDQFRYTGLGVFTRHLEMAARAAGFELHTTFDDLAGSGPVVARIVGRRPADEALSVLLRRRQTSRFAYGDDPVSGAAIEAVQAITDRRTTLTITSDPKIVLAVLELNNEILLADLQDKGTSRELDSWIRYTEGSRRRHRNGFTPASLATPAWKIWVVFRLRSLLRFAVVRRWLTRQYLSQNRAVSVGWISGPLATHHDQFRAGRTLMDAWITLTEHGYYMQPYGSIITDDAARARLLRIIGVDEAPDELVWMIFRAGTSSPPPRSLRKPVEEFVR